MLKSFLIRYIYKTANEKSFSLKRVLNAIKADQHETDVNARQSFTCCLWFSKERLCWTLFSTFDTFPSLFKFTWTVMYPPSSLMIIVRFVATISACSFESIPLKPLFTTPFAYCINPLNAVDGVCCCTWVGSSFILREHDMWNAFFCLFKYGINLSFHNVLCIWWWGSSSGDEFERVFIMFFLT